MPSGSRSLSSETRAAIRQAVASKPVILFMKGTPETPQCGFSRASIQILGRQGVDPAKFSAFNVLEDEELRQGTKYSSETIFGSAALIQHSYRDQRIFRMADNTAALRSQRVCWRMRYCSFYASEWGAVEASRRERGTRTS